MAAFIDYLRPWRESTSREQETTLIVITVKTKVKPGRADAYLAANRAFLEATRRAPGNRWYEQFRSVDDPDTILTLEAFDEAGQDGWDKMAEF